MQVFSQADWHKLMLPLHYFQLANGSCSVILTVFILHFPRLSLFKSFS